MIFKDKRILITGASRGLGRGLVNYFISTGADLVLVSKKSEDLSNLFKNSKTKYHQKIEFISCDLADEKSVFELTSTLQSYKFDSIINNAATQRPFGRLQDISWREWRETIQVNLMSPVYICRALIPKMLIGSGSGSIINISGGGVTAPRPYFSAYATSKSGLVGFTATLAEELRGTKVRVNAIAPGPMPTDMLKQVVDSGVDIVGTDEVTKATKILQERNNSFLLVGKLCEFLISEKSNKITGKLISALWDPWTEFDKLPESVLNSDLYTMRRIVEGDRVDYLSQFNIKSI
jgi:short-subunit dehydrogenase